MLFNWDLVLICKYRILIFCFLVALILTNCNEKAELSLIDEQILNIKKAYLVFRGTNTKQGYFARDFNIKDSLSSHVGFLLFKDNSWSVYHVLENTSDTTDYNIDNLQDFLFSEKNKVFHYSFWRIESISLNESDSLANILNSYKANKIIFDRSFTHNDSTRLYCSEFVCKVLVELDSQKFDFNYHKRGLQGIYKTYFQKDTLEYYPVDMFKYNDNFREHLTKTKH